MPALLLFALAQAAAKPCHDGLCDADRLRPVLRKLERGEGVDIVQIGDSHTAGDQVTGSWRSLLQARFGVGGRGVLPPGRPYAGYLTRGITAAQSEGWSVNGIFGPAYAGPLAPPIGLSGYSLTTSRPGASISLLADPAQRFDRFTVCAMRGPGAGRVTLGAGEERVDWSLDASEEAPDCRSVETHGLVATAAVTVVAGPVTITSWATARTSGGGVTLSNLGTVGAQFTHFGRTDDRVVAREVKEYHPDLIVVAFGTNEAFKPGFSAAGYEAALAAQIARVRRLAGSDVPILLLGAPDSATRLAALQTGESGTSPPCPASVPSAAPMLTPVLVPAGVIVQPLPATGGVSWRPTAALATVQAIQRRRAHSDGLAYWDWSARMGGRCTAHGWVTAATPLMRGDHVHFNKDGGAAVARLLERDIEAAIAADTAGTAR